MPEIDWRERWKEKSRKMFDSSEAKKAFNNIFSFDTGKSILKLRHDKHITKLKGVVESGKESKIFLAEKPDGNYCAVKIYHNRAGNFRDLDKYIRGDRRFSSVPNNRKDLIEEWCKKEYSNLEKASDVVRCPDPIAFQSNVILMEFIGEEQRPYPKLKDVQIENPEYAFEQIISNVQKLWRDERLVHGDLSEFNILVENSSLAWIDFSQGVDKSHPKAQELLERDIKNVTKFFNSQGLSKDPEKQVQATKKKIEV
jgi:RIO kinase 1